MLKITSKEVWRTFVWFCWFNGPQENNAVPTVVPHTPRFLSSKEDKHTSGGEIRIHI